MPTPKSYRWAVNLQKAEGVYATAMADAALIDWLALKEADFADAVTTYETDGDELTGYIGETRHDVESKSGTITRKMKATVEAVEWALALAMGKATLTGSVDPWTATIKSRDLCTVNPYSFSLVEGMKCTGAEATWILYKGCVIDKLTLEAAGKQAVQLGLTIKHDGSETLKNSFSWPASVYAGTRLYGRHVNVKMGAAGTEDVTSILRSWKLAIDMGSVEPPSLGGVYVQELQYGAANPKMDVEVVLKGDKSHALYAAAQADPPTSIKHVGSLIVSANRQIVLTNSQGIVAATVKPSGNETNLTVKYMEEHNATDAGPGVFVVKSGLATLLTASP